MNLKITLYPLLFLDYDLVTQVYFLRRNIIKYISLDIETCGLNPRTCDIVEFAAVLDDLDNPLPIEKLPRFQTYFVQKNFSGEPYALGMHPTSFQRIAEAYQKGLEEDEFGGRYMDIRDLPYALENFLSINGYPKTKDRYKLTVAGKNAAMFDLPFLKEKIVDWKNITFLHRVIDPAILYYQPGDVTLPDSKLCMERAGIAGEVAHTALEDSLAVVKLIRNKLLSK